MYLPDLALSSARNSARRYALRAHFLHDGSHIWRIQCLGGRPREWVSLRAQQHKKSHHGSACSMLFVTIGKTAKHSAEAIRDLSARYNVLTISRHDLQCAKGAQRQGLDVMQSRSVSTVRGKHGIYGDGRGKVKL